MMILGKWKALLTAIMVIFVATFIAVAQDEQESAYVVADFELDELFIAQDEYGNNIGYVPWGDSPANVVLELAEMEREGTVLKASYDITTFGGFTDVFTDGESWVAQDWTDYNAISFWLYGNDSGGIVQFEIFDNRNPDSTGDTAEHFLYQITDDYVGWRQFTIPFASFHRRTDWQPTGAPDDGFGLNEVNGYAFGFPAGVGAFTTYIDDIQLLYLDDLPDAAPETSADDSAVTVDLPPITDPSALAPEAVFGETYYAAFPVKITLDGELDDWKNVPTVYMGQGVGKPATTFAAVADDTHIYLMADVIDPNIISGTHGNDFWNEDSIEFYLNGTGDPGLTRYTDGVAQLTIPPLNIGAAPEDVVLGGVRGSTLNAEVLVFKTDTGWGVEVAIPLESEIWTIEPRHGGEIGFQVHLNGANEINRDLKLIWSLKDTSDQSYQNPSLFGRLVFYEIGQESAAPGIYRYTSELDENGLFADFENGIWLGEDFAGNQLGLVPWGDVPENVQLSIRQIVPQSGMAVPGSEDTANNVLAVAYDIAGWGGYSHIFTDSSNWITQDWTDYNAIGFWLYGNETGSSIQLDLLDNRNPETDGDSAERWFYQINDDYAGWKHFIIPFSLFERRTDWQPDNVLDDGLGLSDVHGYAFNFPAGTGSQIAYLDDLRLFNLENSTAVLISDEEPEGVLILDTSIDWDSREWTLIWSDEFDAETTAPINEDNWTCEIGDGAPALVGWGNQQMEYDTESLSNVAQNGNGELSITARAENPEDYQCWYGSCAFTSARCITQDKVEFTFGRVEARIKIPTGQGIWPAFWMLGANIAEVPWPDSGEIDIMENVGHQPETVHGTIHGPRYSGAAGIGSAYSNDDTDFSEDFHIYAIDWDPNVIRWYVDGELYSTVSVNDLANREWVYNHDFFIILNVAVGGNWPGFPDATTEFPQEMLVDYVRVYQLAGD